MLTLGLGFRASKIKQEKLFKHLILIIASILAFSIRLTSVIKYEPILHEIDPYFQLRAAKYLDNSIRSERDLRDLHKNFYNFLNWFDEKAWYPLGRVVGGTVYPGLILTAVLFKNILSLLNLPISITTACIFLAPTFSVFTVLVTYYLTKEIADDAGAGLLAASLIAISPSLVSRSMAGSFDNEAIAIFCMLLTFYFWIRSVKTGKILYAVLTSLSYFYMSASWGGHVFVINLLPLHVLLNMMLNYFNRKLYVAYTTFYMFGVFLSMQVPFIGFQVIFKADHFLSLIIFVFCQILAAKKSIRRYLFEDDLNYKRVKFLALGTFSTGLLLFFLFLRFSKNENFKTLNLEARISALLFPSFRQKSPIFSSVAEHQPASWSVFYLDFQHLLISFPVGIWWCFDRPSSYRTFLVVYGICGMYFGAVMNSIVKRNKKPSSPPLILAPAICISSAIGTSHFLYLFTKELDIMAIFHRSNRAELIRLEKIRNKNKAHGDYLHSNRREVASIGIIILLFFLMSFYLHSFRVIEKFYSNPTVFMVDHKELEARRKATMAMTQSSSYHDRHHNQHYQYDSLDIPIVDDFREGYSWIRQNTPEDSKILSWWDYGYHVSEMANRTTIVDNNTWNSTHISEVGKIFSLDEYSAIRLIKKYDINYILVKFGGAVGYPNDDLDKFPWMIRMSNSNGFPFNELDYMYNNRYFKIDNSAPKRLTDSLLFKFSYYNFAKFSIDEKVPLGYDLVRQQVLFKKDISFRYFEEAYTTENWLYRIYRVKDIDWILNRGQ